MTPSKNPQSQSKHLTLVILAFAAASTTFAFAGVSSYSGPGGTGTASRFVLPEQQISEEAVELIVSGRAPSESLRAKLEEKRAEMAQLVGEDASSKMTDEALAALLIQQK